MALANWQSTDESMRYSPLVRGAGTNSLPAYPTTGP
jgi:hypothetical protein